MSASDRSGDDAPRYGFGGRLSSEFPSQVVADTTEICNFACVHCSHPTFRRSEHYGARQLRPDLNRKMVDEVAESGRGITQYIRYSGNGEPLLNRAIFEMLADAVERSGTTVTLTTNGSLLDDGAVARLLETGVHLVDVSLDALLPETFSRIRVNGDLTEVAANVRRLIKAARAAGSRTKVVVSFIEQPENAAEAEGFERSWREEGAHQVVIRRLHSNASSTTRLVQLVSKRAAGETRRPCLYPWERILLVPSGHLAFCPQDWIHASLLADFSTTTIREVWQGPRYHALRKAHLENDFSAHEFCGQCSDWAITRWPGAGLSYADLVQSLDAPSSGGGRTSGT